MSRGKTAGAQADDCHRKQSKKLPVYKNSAQYISLYVYKENLLDVTAWFYIQSREDNIRHNKCSKAYATGKVNTNQTWNLIAIWNY
jgi:hypothetical protein